eukprot:jgi/Botrbrau1/18314/Bobra.0179s0042.2
MTDIYGTFFSGGHNRQLLLNSKRLLTWSGGAVCLLCLSQSLVIVRSVLALITVFAMGALCGIAAIGVILILFWKAASEELNNEDSVRKLPAPPFTTDTVVLTHQLPEQEKQIILQEVRQEALHHRDAPPHPFANSGGYSGWIWTVSPSAYDRSQALAQWPPATTGPNAFARRWWATLRNQTLYLVLQLPETESTAEAPVVEVALTGCKLDIVRDGLKTKSCWWRKCPLELSHASRKLLGGETSFYFFAVGGAAKEQWYTALSRAIAAGGAAALVESMYLSFCRHLYSSKLDAYPEVADEEEEALAASSPSTAETSGSSKEGSRRWLGGWRRRGHSSHSTSSATSAAAQLQSSAARKVVSLPEGPGGALSEGPGPASDPPGSHKKGFVSPFDLDEAWMGGSKAKPAPSMALQSAPLPVTDEAAAPATGSTELQGGRTEDSAPSEVSTDTEAKLSGPQVQGLSPSRHSDKGGSNLQSHEFQQVPTARREKSPDIAGIPAFDTSSTGSGLDREDSEHSKIPRGLLIEEGVNLFIARIGFDLLRSPAFHEKVHAHIQKKLNDVRVPSFMDGMQVVEVDVGNNVPVLRNLRVVSDPTRAMWPQFACDFDYTGKVTVLIETKVDVREGPTWSHVDRFINRIDGSAGTGMKGAASAPVLGASLNMGDPLTGVTEGGEDDADEDDLDEDTPSESGSAPVSGAEEFGTGVEGGTAMAQPSSRFFAPLRQRVARHIRKLADNAAERLSQVQLRLLIHIEALRGPVCVWIPPPPGDRLWFSFTSTPQLVAHAHPVVHGRMLRVSYAAVANRVSRWIVSKLQRAMAKNMLFPSCSDLRLSFLLPLDSPHATSGLSLPTAPPAGIPVPPASTTTNSALNHPIANLSTQSIKSAPATDKDGGHVPADVYSRVTSVRFAESVTVTETTAVSTNVVQPEATVGAPALLANAKTGDLKVSASTTATDGRQLSEDSSSLGRKETSTVRDQKGMSSGSASQEEEVPAKSKGRRGLLLGRFGVARAPTAAKVANNAATPASQPLSPRSSAPMEMELTEFTSPQPPSSVLVASPSNTDRVSPSPSEQSVETLRSDKPAGCLPTTPPSDGALSVGTSPLPQVNCTSVTAGTVLIDSVLESSPESSTCAAGAPAVVPPSAQDSSSGIDLGKSNAELLPSSTGFSEPTSAAASRSAGSLPSAAREASEIKSHPGRLPGAVPPTVSEPPAGTGNLDTQADPHSASLGEGCGAGSPSGTSADSAASSASLASTRQSGPAADGASSSSLSYQQAAPHAPLTGGQKATSADGLSSINGWDRTGNHLDAAQIDLPALTTSPSCITADAGSGGQTPPELVGLVGGGSLQAGPGGSVHEGDLAVAGTQPEEEGSRPGVPLLHGSSPDGSHAGTVGDPSRGPVTPGNHEQIIVTTSTVTSTFTMVGTDVLEEQGHRLPSSADDSQVGLTRDGLADLEAPRESSEGARGVSPSDDLEAPDEEEEYFRLLEGIRRTRSKSMAARSGSGLSTGSGPERTAYFPSGAAPAGAGMALVHREDTSVSSAGAIALPDGEHLENPAKSSMSMGQVNRVAEPGSTSGELGSGLKGSEGGGDAEKNDAAGNQDFVGNRYSFGKPGSTSAPLSRTSSESEGKYLFMSSVTLSFLQCFD